MMQGRLMALALGAVFSVANAYSISGAGARQTKVRAVGTVIAYDLPVSGLAMTTSVPIDQFLIVRVDRSTRRRQEARYIKVRYRRWFNEPRLPEGVFDGNSKWRFLLTRDNTCDGPLRELQSVKGKTEDGKEIILRGLRKTPGGQKGEVSDDLTLPCYVLRYGKVRPAQ